MIIYMRPSYIALSPRTVVTTESEIKIVKYKSEQRRSEEQNRRNAFQRQTIASTPA